MMVDVSNIGCMGCQVDRIRRSGVSVMVRRQTGLMHHKFILMDEATVMTGSFNWTRQVSVSTQYLTNRIDVMLSCHCRLWRITMRTL